MLDLTTVAIVLDPDFGAELLTLAALHPVWIVDSPANRPMIEAVWAQRRAEKVPREVNVFRAIDGLSPAEHVAALLRSVEAAHGPAVQTPAFRALVVEGVRLDDALNAVLLSRGATATRASERGFTALFERG